MNEPRRPAPGPKVPRNFVPEPYAYHQELDLRIDTLTNLGLGLGRDDGWVVMVPFTLPGERVRARVFRNRANYSEADLLEVLEPSPRRAEPACPLFGTCGGCQYQHLDYPGQLEWKRGQVRELFERIGGLADPPVLPAHGSPRLYGYRSKLTPHWNKPRPGEGLGDVGFLRVGQRQRLVDVPACPIATDAINEALPEARESLRRESRAKKKRRGGTLLLRHVLEGVVTDPQAVVSEKVGAHIFQFKAGDFFQNNPFVLPEMVDYVAGQVDPGDVRFLVDAYCGVGLFALALSSRMEAVRGVEISESAVNWARNNALINRVENCTFLTGAAEAIFAGIDFPPGATAVIVDPPRKGCDRDFLRQLIAFGPRRVVYVSCDPATQARDVAILAAEGPYRVQRIQPFDLFPQTRHIESVATLERDFEA